MIQWGQTVASEWTLRECRVFFWNRLYREAPAALDELDRELLGTTRDSSDDDRLQFVLLRAFTAIFEEGSSSTRRTLKAVLLHGFASGGVASGEDASLGASGAGSGIYEVVDRHLTWQEAYSLVGGNPADYSARSRLCIALRAECQRQWEAVFGSAAPRVLSEEEAHV